MPLTNIEVPIAKQNLSCRFTVRDLVSTAIRSGGFQQMATEYYVRSKGIETDETLQLSREFVSIKVVDVEFEVSQLIKATETKDKYFVKVVLNGETRVIDTSHKNQRDGYFIVCEIEAQIEQDPENAREIVDHWEGALKLETERNKPPLGATDIMKGSLTSQCR